VKVGGKVEGGGRKVKGKGKGRRGEGREEEGWGSGTPIFLVKGKVMVNGVQHLATRLTATGTNVPYGITQCYLPPDRGDIPALTPAEAGTRFSDPGGM